MKIKQSLFLLLLITILVSCRKEEFSREAAIINSFSVKGHDNTVFKGVINEDETITIKVSPYLDAESSLSNAVPTFYLSKGATVLPDPKLPQDFAQEGGVRYTVTAEDGSTQQEYVISWDISDQLADGEGFSYAEIGTAKNFVELGYPGEFDNFNQTDPKHFGDLDAIPAYCGDHIVLLSRAYIDSDPLSPFAVRTFDKNTLEPSGPLDLNGIEPRDLKLITSDYKGHLVGMVVSKGITEFFYWTDIDTQPQSLGSLQTDLASATDGSANFQVAGDVLTKAWITASAPRNTNGEHYRLQVNGGQVNTNVSKVITGYSSEDGSGFQMISPLDDSDEPRFVVGDTDGTPGEANSVKAYINSFAGSTQTTMPGLWQNTLQAWWVGTGSSTAKYGGRAPFVSALLVNGKSYALLTSGTAWWHAAAVLNADLQSLAHENLNIAESINRAWSFGSAADWYYNENDKEAYLTIWFGRIGLKTFKLTCYE